MLKNIAIPHKTRLFLLAALSLTVILLFSYLYYRNVLLTTAEDKFQDLQSISSLKISQIDRWRQERFADVLVLTHSPMVLASVEQLIKNPEDKSVRQSLTDRLSLTETHNFYTRIVLYNSDLTVLLSPEPVNRWPASGQPDYLNEALRSDSPRLSRFYLDSVSKKPRINISAPFINRSGRHIAVIELQIDPAEYLYPLIQSWPIPSATSETVLLTRAGNDVMFLNELRHFRQTALKFKISASDSQRIAIKAINGARGRIEGLDYRGAVVLGYIQQIPATDIIMITKIDKNEAMKELTFRIYLVVGFVLILVLISGGALAIFNYSRQRNLYKELYNKERLQREEHELFRTTLYSIGDAVITTDAECRVIQMNPVAESLTGWKESDALGRQTEEVFRIINENTRENVKNPVKIVLEKGIIVGLANHTILVSKTGEEFPIADSGAPIKNESGEIIGVVLVFRDQTKERMAEAALIESEMRFRSLFRNMAEGVALHEIVFNENNVPENYIVVNCNPSYIKILGLEKEDVIGSTADKVYSTTKPPYLEEFCSVALSGHPKEFETYFAPMDKHFYISVVPWGNNGFATIFTDITERKKAEEEALISQKRVQLHFDLTPLGAIEFDVNFGITSWNRGAESIFGYTAEETIGGSAYDFIVPDEAHAEIDQALDHILRSKGNLRGINRNKTKDGRIITVEWYNTLLIDQRGDVLGIASLCEDITGRIEHEQALRNSEERWRRIFEASTDPILLLVNGLFADCNPATVKKLRYPSKQQLIGREPSFLSPEYQPDGQLSSIKADEMIKLAHTNGFHLFEWVHITSDNEPIDFEVMLTSFQLNGSTAYHVVWRDITDRKQMIRELIAAKEKAEEMNRIKSNFFSNMSHELRTPLIGILGYSEVLQDKLAEQPDLSKMAATINNGGKRLLETLNLILNLSKLESAKFDIYLRRMNLHDLLNEVFTLYQPAAYKKGLDFTFTSQHTPCFCNIDEKLFRDILNNLVNNAIKYTAAGKIWITLAARGGKAVIRIGDTGIGIAREKHSIIWEEFRQVSEGYGRSFEGTGLGLTLTKKYTDLLGGTISIESEEKKGAVFTLEFPLASEDGLTSAPDEQQSTPVNLPAAGTDNASLPRILYVEDDQVSRDVAEIMTEGIFRLDFAVSADEAIMKIRDTKFDTIMLDINLGKGLDGVQLAQVIRSIAGCQYMPLIALSAYAMDKDKEEFMSKGFTHYLSKPFTRDQLRAIINKALNSK